MTQWVNNTQSFLECWQSVTFSCKVKSCLSLYDFESPSVHPLLIYRVLKRHLESQGWLLKRSLTGFKKSLDLHISAGAKNWGAGRASSRSFTAICFNETVHDKWCLAKRLTLGNLQKYTLSHCFIIVTQATTVQQTMSLPCTYVLDS